MLSNPALSWREIDAQTVEVTADSRGSPVRVRFLFNDEGDVHAIEADDRPRTEGNAFVPRGWRGEFSDCREMNGYRIPTRGEISWLLDEGPFTYWRGEVNA